MWLEWLSQTLNLSHRFDAGPMGSEARRVDAEIDPAVAPIAAPARRCSTLFWGPPIPMVDEAYPERQH